MEPPSTLLRCFRVAPRVIQMTKVSGNEQNKRLIRPHPMSHVMIWYEWNECDSNWQPVKRNPSSLQELSAQKIKTAYSAQQNFNNLLEKLPVRLELFVRAQPVTSIDLILGDIQL